jgi:uncharacterized SAM-binding protein YcdF (DUF218 family)
MKKKSVILITTLVIVLTGLLLIMRNAGTWLVKNDTLHQADAMIMLMGSIPDRVLQTADLYQQHHAPKLIIVQESMGAYRQLEARGASIISTTQQCRDASIALGIPADSFIILPGDARSTQQEATIIREYLKAHKAIDTITLVTSSDHSRRASMIFEKAFSAQGMKVVVQSCPSKYTSYTGKGWWKNKEGIQTVLMEYMKMGNFWFFERRRL